MMKIFIKKGIPSNVFSGKSSILGVSSQGLIKLLPLILLSFASHQLLFTVNNSKCQQSLDQEADKMKLEVTDVQINLPSSIPQLFANAQVQGGYRLFPATQESVFPADDKTLKEFYEKYKDFFKVPERRAFTIFFLSTHGKIQEKEKVYALTRRFCDAISSGISLEEISKAHQLDHEQHGFNERATINKAGALSKFIKLKDQNAAFK